MASKMKRTKKLRTKHFKEPTISIKHRTQLEGEITNKQFKRTPWKKAKDKRFHSADRVAKRAKYYASKVA